MKIMLVSVDINQNNNIVNYQIANINKQMTITELMANISGQHGKSIKKLDNNLTKFKINEFKDLKDPNQTIDNLIKTDSKFEEFFNGKKKFTISVDTDDTKLISSFLQNNPITYKKLNLKNSSEDVNLKESEDPYAEFSLMIYSIYERLIRKNHAEDDAEIIMSYYKDYFNTIKNQMKELGKEIKNNYHNNSFKTIEVMVEKSLTLLKKIREEKENTNKNSVNITTEKSIESVNLEKVQKEEKNTNKNSSNATAEEFTDCVNKCLVISSLTVEELTRFLELGGRINIVTPEKINESKINIDKETLIITGCNSGYHRSQVYYAVLNDLDYKVEGVIAGGDSAINDTCEIHIITDVGDDYKGSATNFEKAFGFKKIPQVGAEELKDYNYGEGEILKNAKEYYQKYINDLPPAHFILSAHSVESIVKILLKRANTLNTDLKGFKVTFIPWDDEIRHPPKDCNFEPCSLEAYEHFANKFKACFNFV